MRTALYAALALLGFAANSLLCRLALRTGEIDAASFTAIRLAAGALVLAVLIAARSKTLPRAGSWLSAAALAVYAALFSFAYLELSAGTGALLLFGSVQLTMFGIGAARGDRPTPAQVLGCLIALVGLVFLATPTIAPAPPLPAALMVGAGMAWGIYTLRARGVTDPLAATAGNFARTVPIALVLAAIAFTERGVPTARGAILAITSGGIASGVGYSLWYAAVPALGAARAAAIQLAVPVLAAIAGIALLGEPLGIALVIGGTVILLGLALSLFAKLPTPTDD